MRKLLISAAVAASAFAVASPAAAQIHLPQQYGYGHYGNQGQARSLLARVDRIRQEIRMLDRRNILSNREANRLERDAANLRNRVRSASYNGLNRNERHSLETRIVRLERSVRIQATDGNRRVGYNDGRWQDRDRDGRNDRYEDDRGRDHD